MEQSSATIKVPAEATVITSPLIVKNWSYHLATHQDKVLVNFFLAGISQDFSIGYHNSQSPLKSAKRNLFCALKYPKVVDHYLEEKLALERIAGPFQRELILYHKHISIDSE